MSRCAFRGLALLALSQLFACDAPNAPAPAPTWEGICIDLDGDGYGFQCELGDDCNDELADEHEGCASRCRSASEGCACDELAQPITCSLPYQLTTSGSLLCSTGTRYCRDGQWTGCEGVKSFTRPATLGVLREPIINGDAGSVACSPCSPDCFRVDDEVALPDGGSPGALESSSSGGITLGSEDASDAGVGDAGLLDDVHCTPGVAPDFDCDGVPDRFDPYPDEAPFATDHQTIFMGLAPGESREQAFDIQFFLNTADVYFYVDMTASMEGERDNLIASLTTGNYLPSAGAGIECADRDFDGAPDDELKQGGIAGNIACLIRDSRLGAGWFRDIPFEGPYANGTRVAPSDFAMFEHRQDITSDVAAVRSALMTFQTAGNYNTPEGSMQGLWSLATGEGLYAGWNRPGIPARAHCPDGTWGYPCFRSEAVPIVVHITDAPLQNGPSPTSPQRANYLSDCVQECSCVRESCFYGFCYCVEQSCECGNTQRHPLNYDANVVAGMSAGSETSYRSLASSAEALASAQQMGTVDDVLVTYVGSTEVMASDLSLAALGSCPGGTSAWSSSSQGAPDAVFRFTVRGTKTLTVSARGSRFDSALLVKRVGSSVALDCNNNLSSSNTAAEITRSFSPGDYYAILKGRTGSEKGWFQLTVGDKTKQQVAAFAAKSWLGPQGTGAGGVLEALRQRGVRVITVNSSRDAYLEEQSRALSSATEALDVHGQPLTFAIQSDGTGMGSAVIDAINLLAGNLAMDIGVVLREEPDQPTPRFEFQVEAIDQPGDLCDPPVDMDGDPEHTPDTHVACRPGAAPQFKVRFRNPPVPNHVPLNPNDANGGYSMRLELIGDGAYVVDRIPVYLVPQAVADESPATRYVASASYEQNVGATACIGNEAPTWSGLYWRAALPTGTALSWEACAADSEAGLANCTMRPVARVHANGSCATDRDCVNGMCAPDGFCRFITGPSCRTNSDCGKAGSCSDGLCHWMDSPIDVKAAFAGGAQGRDFVRVRTTLLADETRGEAPTLFSWRLDYTCSAQE